jgi:phosphatidylserine/phosphatidylglycerophosphate/cardiolipin synthase-like enzyme
MDPRVLLAQLRSLLARAPNFAAVRGLPMEHTVWLAQAHALISRWDQLEAMSFKAASDFLMGGLNREMNIAEVFGTLHRAVADLELKVPETTDQAFGPGAVYDFFKALGEVLSSAKKSLLIVDPYFDAQIFDSYLSRAPAGVAVRVLIGKASPDLKAAAESFKTQYHADVEVRASNQLHDRLFFVDGDVCWVLGQSIKDAAVKNATYLAPLAPDVTASKLTLYEDVWRQARAI